jgi:hypothetical protein
VKISGAEMAGDDDLSNSFDNGSSCSSTKTEATGCGGAGGTGSDVSDVTDNDFDDDGGDRELSEFLWNAFAGEENEGRCHPNTDHYGQASCDIVGYPLFDPDLELDALCM